MIESNVGVLATLVGVAGFYFWLEQVSGWKLFNLFPPLLWIYATPVVLNNTGILSGASPVYGQLSELALPVFICLMLLTVNVPAVVRVMGGGVLVMLMGSLGIVVGGVLAFYVVHGWLEPDAWKGFGALAGSWIGGTGNMGAVAAALDTPASQLGLAILSDNLVYVVWLPILLGSREFAVRFNRWARVPASRLEDMDRVAADLDQAERPVSMRQYLYLGVLSLGVTWGASLIAPLLPEFPPVLSTSTWRVLLITTAALALSATPARELPGSRNLATAIIYVFVAGMGARASLSGLSQAPAFVLGAFIWIFVHGLFCLAGAWIFKVDVHSAAIASAANVGGAASAPVVAAYHRQSLVPVSILMALIGYALGNYLAILTAQLCQWVVS
jgi:uncharacterized membrane protein